MLMPKSENIMLVTPAEMSPYFAYVRSPLIPYFFFLFFYFKVPWCQEVCIEHSQNCSSLDKAEMLSTQTQKVGAPYFRD